MRKKKRSIYGRERGKDGGKEMGKGQWRSGRGQRHKINADDTPNGKGKEGR